MYKSLKALIHISINSKGDRPKSAMVISQQNGYRWKDLDEYYQSVNGLKSIGESLRSYKQKTNTNYQSIKMSQIKEWPRRESPLRGAGRNRHTPNGLCACLLVVLVEIFPTIPILFGDNRRSTS
jgi:hypothetical protein